MSTLQIPDDPIAAALALMDARRHEDALEVLAVATAKNPTHGTPLLLIAQCQLTLGQKAEALATTERTLSLIPQSAIAMRLHALALHEGSRNAEALQFANLSLETNPAEALTWLTLSWIHAALGNRKTARSSALKALEFDPELAEAHNALGLIELAGHTKWRAVKHFEKALELEPNRAMYRNNLGAAFQSTRRFGKAHDHLLAAAKEDPTSHLPRENLVRTVSSFFLIAIFGINVVRHFPLPVLIAYPFAVLGFGAYRFRRIPRPIFLQGLKQTGKIWLIFPGLIIALLMCIGGVASMSGHSVPAPIGGALTIAGLAWIGIAAWLIRRGMR